MAKARVTSENFTSQAVFAVTESAANTLTFEKLETGLSVYDKIGWVISRIEYRMALTTPALFNGTGDSLAIALTITNSLTGLSDDNPAILFMRKFLRLDFGTAANASIMPLTFVDDYSTLPGGGILSLPNPLYCAVAGSGLSAASSIIVRMYFQPIELTDQDYFNLVQSRQLLIST